jgi:hypothetical protein
MTTDNELYDVANDVYDYLFDNYSDERTNFVRTFNNSSIDNMTNTIYLEGGELGNYIIKIEKAA